MIFPLDQSAPKDPLVIGAKAVGLIEMMECGLPVPSGFCLPTNYKFDPESDRSLVNSVVRVLADITQTRWGGISKAITPLLVSVRSGAPVSMPGMMDTILNVGLTRDSIQTLNETYNAPPAFGFDCYRRLISMYGTSVSHIDKRVFAEYYDAARDFFIDVSVSERAVRVLVEKYEMLYERETGHSFPSVPTTQLVNAIAAVFDSWNSPTAESYRILNDISYQLGTAVIVQQMKFGNVGENSATGVVFTHNPNTGAKGWFGEYVVCGQGEDVVSGTHLTESIDEITRNSQLAVAGKVLKSSLSKLYNRQNEILDVEFTIENGQLCILQYRVAKCSRKANVRFALDQAREGSITSEEATARILSLMPQTEMMVGDGEMESVGFGVPIGGSIVCAPIAIGQEVADQYIRDGLDYIFVAPDTSPSDHVQMSSAVGILTAQGGTLSHAAVIARSWDKTCIVGFEDMKVFDGHIIIDQIRLHSDDKIQINGITGEVHVPTP